MSPRQPFPGWGVGRSPVEVSESGGGAARTCRTDSRAVLVAVPPTHCFSASLAPSTSTAAVTHSPWSHTPVSFATPPVLTSSPKPVPVTPRPGISGC